MLGSGAESRGTMNVINASQGQLGDVSRQQAETKAATALDTAKTNQGAAVTTRGQDISATTAANSLAGENARASFTGGVTQRGQDLQATQAAGSLQAEYARIAAGQRQTVLQGLLAALNGGGAY